MKLRAQVSGEYNKEALSRLKFPIAWNGAVSAQQRAAEEADLSALVAEARDALVADSDAVGVEIRNGRVVATIHADEES